MDFSTAAAAGVDKSGPTPKGGASSAARPGPRARDGAAHIGHMCTTKCRLPHHHLHVTIDLNRTNGLVLPFSYR